MTCDQDDELEWYEKLGGMDSDELEHLSKFNLDEAEVWDGVANASRGVQRETYQKFARWCRERARMFSSWAAAEEKRFEKWQKEKEERELEHGSS